MSILPILSAVRRNLVGAILISLQIALTVAIVCNSLSIIVQHVQHMLRPSGIDEANIFTLHNEWVGKTEDLKARVMADINALRAMPGVEDAQATNSFPLHSGGSSTGVSLSPDQHQPTASTAVYLVDDHALHTYGLKLIAGRWFRADEIEDMSYIQGQLPHFMVVTQALAQRLFPGTSALGQSVYMGAASATRIIGIVERAQTPWAGFSWGESFIENSTFLPYRFLSNGQYYVVRTRPGQRAAVMQAVEDKLYAITEQRVIESLQTYSQSRSNIYEHERSASAILGTVCALLLSVTAFGVVGLTMYWVTQRRRYIGLRRALGARRIDILRYFQVENLLIAGTGALLGVALGLGGNIWLASTLELTRMTLRFMCAGAAIVLCLSQAAVIWPALRAASISPAIATRGL